jgi:WD40 repeat protein
MESKYPKVENLTIAANSNTVLNAITFNKVHKIVAYCTSNTILIMEPNHYKESVPKVLFSLKGHSERVNAISWLSDDILVSVSADKSVILWTFKGDPKDYTSWSQR